MCSLTRIALPRTEEELFHLALARLDDLQMDLEDGDESEAVLWRNLSEETEVRTVCANRLRAASRSRYTIASEEELADATRTDIRLHSPHVLARVQIELKIADKWTLTQLRERLENQLIGQYMRVSQYGIFLMVYYGTRKSWTAPGTKDGITFSDLVEVLKQEAIALIKKYPKVASIEVLGIDLMARSRRNAKVGNIGSLPP